MALPIYYFGQINTQNNTINILFQLSNVTNPAPKKYLVDVLKNTYVEIPLDRNVDLSDINNLLKTYGIRVDSDEGLLKYDPNDQAFNNDLYYKTFLTYCNPSPKLPVDLNEDRYFYKEAEAEEVSKSGLIDDSPEILILSGFKSPDDPVKFINPITGIEYDKLPIGTYYIEESKEELDERKSRLEPIKDTTITTKDQLTALIGQIPQKTIELFTKQEILKQIEDDFGKHISFNLDFINNAIRAITITGIQEEGVTLRSHNNQITTNLPNSVARGELNRRFKLVSFIRSYIDLYHDITKLGDAYCPKLYEIFYNSLTNDADKTYLRNKINSYQIGGPNSIFTSSGEVSQTKCKVQIEKLADEYIEFCHNREIKTNPKEKENALVISASMDNEKEINELIDTLIKDGVTGYYVESANNDIGETLFTKSIIGGKPQLKIYNLSLGDWDAGSGFSGNKLKNPKPTAQDRVEISFGSDNPILDLFGLINVSVNEKNNELTATFKEYTDTISGGTVYPEKIIKVTPRQKFAVNSVTKATNDMILRGVSTTTQNEKEVKPIKTDPKITINSSFQERASLISLKTWTDLIQIVIISKLMSQSKNNKILTVIYDQLCETTARIYGLGHVLRTEGKVVTYYNYNINSRKLTKELREAKTKLKTYISNNISLLQTYLQNWFNLRINSLDTIKRSYYEPVLYFVSELFMEKYTTAQTKSIVLLNNISQTDIKLIPKSLDDYIEAISSSATLLGELFDTNSKFEIAIQRIEAVGTRGNRDIFLDAYDFVKQQIVNTFSTANAIKLRAMIASTFAYVFLKYYAYDRCLSKIESVKQEVIKTIMPRVPAPNITTNYGISSAVVNRIAMYKNTNIEKSLSAIRAIPEGELIDILQGISDIQIACQYLLKKSGYRDYIVISSVNRTNINPAFAFSTIVDEVQREIQRHINAGRFFGGKKSARLSRTYKRKHNKRKTYKKRN